MPACLLLPPAVPVWPELLLADLPAGVVPEEPVRGQSLPRSISSCVSSHRFTQIVGWHGPRDMPDMSCVVPPHPPRCHDPQHVLRTLLQIKERPRSQVHPASCHVHITCQSCTPSSQCLACHHACSDCHCAYILTTINIADCWNGLVQANGHSVQVWSRISKQQQ